MKNFFKFIAIISLFVMILGGCDLVTKETEEPTTGKEEETITEETPPVETTADTILDDQILNTAVANMDIEKCKEILDEAKQTECGQVVNGLNISNSALKNLNEKECDEIQIDRYKENCVQNIKDEKDRLAKINEDKEKIESYSDIEKTAIEKSDSDTCEDIEDENLMYDCKYNVIVNMALQSKNSELCKEIGKESYIQTCVNLVESNI